MILEAKNSNLVAFLWSGQCVICIDGVASDVQLSRDFHRVHPLDTVSEGPSGLVGDVPQVHSWTERYLIGLLPFQYREHSLLIGHQ